MAEHPDTSPARAIETAALKLPVTSPLVVSLFKAGAEEDVTRETEIRDQNLSDILAVMNAFMHTRGQGTSDETLYPHDLLAESV